MSEALEHHHHASEAAGGGARRAALLIAVAAALLALCEQGAKHAELRTSQNAIAAADLWAQYQAKSVRSTLSQDLADMTALLAPATPELAARRDALVARMRADVARFDHAPQDGREALAERAHVLEERRDHAHEVLESFDNASAALQLSIVLATASVITAAAPLLWVSLALAAAGAALGLLGLVAPAVGALL